ncbi:MAG: DNA polymerase III subunit delta [Bacteroidetes bacterium]|nr:DNA polymerase III subunit delta [Bacteroidota bacterium]
MAIFAGQEYFIRLLVNMARDSGFENILSDLKNKIYYPVYLLSGDETYFIDMVSDFIEENVLSGQEKEFNQTIVYGKDVDAATVISYAKRYPMMSNYQVLIVKEAQDLDDLDTFLPYVQNPVNSTILVLCYKYGKLDKRKSLYKAFEKSGVVMESALLYDNKIPEWINNYVTVHGYSVSPKAAVLLAEFVGNELSKIVNELTKLFINLPEGSEITEDVIERNIGISKDFNVFELQKALGRKDVYKSNMIIGYFAANLKENPLVKVIPNLYSYFTKVLIYHYLPDKSRNNAAAALSVNPFFVQDYQTAAKNYPVYRAVAVISLLREYDLKAKGLDNASATDGELMKELIFKILH